MMNSVAALRAAAGRLPLETYRVDGPVDERGQYQLQLASEFPFASKRIGFAADQPKPPFTWHTYLELFVLRFAVYKLHRTGSLRRSAVRGDPHVLALAFTSHQ